MDDFEKALLDVSEQRDEVWRDARCGKFTASEIWKLMTDPQSKADKDAGNWSKTALTYIHTKVAEELTGQIHQNSNAYPLVWGEEQEPVAKQVLEHKTGLQVTKCTFIPFTDHSGGSPDGLIGENSILEIKCPYNSSNQVEYLLVKDVVGIKKVWPEYYWQCQMNMLFSKRTHCYFVTYDPRFTNEKHILKVIEFDAEPEDQNLCLQRIEKAIATKLEIIESLK